MPKRNTNVFVCLNRRPDGNPKGSCASRNSEAVYAALKEGIAERGLHKTEVRALSCSCLDFCAEGPTVCVEPQHVYYGHVQLDDIPELIDCIARGTVLHRLRVDTPKDSSET